MYTRQVTRVSWNGMFSLPFTVSNGVKQGGVLSPILFCVYIDRLLHLLLLSLALAASLAEFLLAPWYMQMILCCCPLQLAVCGPCCMCVTCLPTTFQSSLMPLNPIVYGSKLGASLLYTIWTLLVSWLVAMPLSSLVAGHTLVIYWLQVKYNKILNKGSTHSVVKLMMYCFYLSYYLSERVFSVVLYCRQMISICLLILYAFLDANKSQ